MNAALREFVRLLAGDSNSVRQRFGGAFQQRFYDEEIDLVLAQEGDPYSAAALLWEITAGSNALLSLAFGVKVNDPDAVDRASRQALEIAERLRQRASRPPGAPDSPEVVVWAWDWKRYLEEVLCAS